ncbi:nuclear GTPase SLIP-GC-like isoform X3 [Myripristis murdjan]|uniref:nuclear GTPase SLIP-GC-like isoform X3 n=1 Tax=Myripristis murdjan TaxID=586833 RepID=UPI001176193B|nr:nuclear GTPase SLIP-GC-like isoform X3 [Myripristis murdjan]
METFDFVRDKLNEWGLSELIPRFEENKIDKESFLILQESDINDLIREIGPRAKFKQKLKEFVKLSKKARKSQGENSGQPQMRRRNEQASEGNRVQKRAKVQQSPGQAKRGESSGQIGPSTSTTNYCTPQVTEKEAYMLGEVKEIMKRVHNKLDEQGHTKLNAFLKDKIRDLEKGKKELVGVFGKTGAGKSSLINTIIGEKALLPSGTVSACTSVMIKVEANMETCDYIAEIEFITKEAWKDEVWYFLSVDEKSDDIDDDDGDDGHIADDGQTDDDEDYNDHKKRITALFGEDIRRSPEELRGSRYFREIPEFLQSKKKILKCESASQLSENIAKFTRNDKKLETQYWPLVKCVTIKVPKVTDLLEHITLVDLPGNGDFNKSRDEMWKECVGSCSTVWIVSETNRAAAEKEAWEILENAISLMGNGGECQRLMFICTKSDDIGISDASSKEEERAQILLRNQEAKDQVTSSFQRQHKIKKHFSGDSNFFQVFTVSSKEFYEGKCLQKSDTEIPQLRKFLQDLNDRQSKTLNYVCGAYGILCLIQGANCRESARQKQEVCTILDQRLKQELDKVRRSMEETYKAFENRLREGVKKAQESCENDLKSILVSGKKKNKGFHKTLKCLVKNNGIHKKTKKPEININEKLASGMRNHIDETFKETFPNEERRGPFKGAISDFTLDTEALGSKYQDVLLQLTFLKTEEAIVKTKLKDIIRDEKKRIYHSLARSIQDSMKPCYKNAAEIHGKDSLKNMRDTIKNHLHESKDIMFDQAKDHMLTRLRNLTDRILNTLNQDMVKSIEVSLKTDDRSIPVVTREYEKVKTHYENLSSNTNTNDMVC